MSGAIRSRHHLREVLLGIGNDPTSLNQTPRAIANLIEFAQVANRLSLQEELDFVRTVLKIIDELIGAGYDNDKHERRLSQATSLLKKWFWDKTFPRRFGAMRRPKSYYYWKTYTKPRLYQRIKNVANLAPLQLENIRDHLRRHGLVAHEESIEHFLGVELNDTYSDPSSTI